MISTRSLPLSRGHILRMVTAVVASLALATPLTTWAGSKDHELARQALAQGQILPLRTVIEQVEREQQGQVLKVEFEHDDGQFIYEIRLLQSDGRLVKLEIDARNGQLLKMKRKN